MSLHTVFGNLVIGPLEKVAAPPCFLRGLLQRSALRLMSSELIIEDSHRPFDVPVRETPSAQAAGSRTRQLIDPIVAAVGEDGLAPHFLRLIRSFAAVNLAADDPAGDALAQEWMASDQRYCFLMTDKGGPAIPNWQSFAFEEDGRRYLKINKVWAINGADFSIAAIAVRGAQTAFPVPATYMLGPAHCAALKKLPAGRPFLGGAVQLGNVQGTIELGAEDRPRAGRASDAERALDTARMNFVRALMQHLHWLAAQGRAALDDDRAAAARYLYDVGTAITEETVYTNLTTMRVKALKFASNELLTDMVAEDRVPAPADQRDLLGFAKMEGSSYFCLTRLFGQINRKDRLDRPAGALSHAA
jgi:hypothetical protein